MWIHRRLPCWCFGQGVLAFRVWCFWLIRADAFHVCFFCMYNTPRGTDLSSIQKTLITRFLDRLLVKMQSLSPTTEESYRILTCRGDIAFGRGEKREACRLYLEAAASVTRFFLASEQRLWTSGDQHVPARILECVEGDARAYCVLSQLMPRPDYAKCFTLMREEVGRLVGVQGGWMELEEWGRVIWDVQMAEFFVHFVAGKSGDGIDGVLYRKEERLRKGAGRGEIEHVRFMFLGELLMTKALL
jgi:hypothetical protein